MMLVALRFLVAGTIVAALPTVAERFGPRTAALVLLVPVVTAAGLVALHRERGPAAAEAAAFAALPGLGAVAAFLIGVGGTLRLGGSLPVALGVGAGLWFAAAAAVLVLR